MPLEVTAVDELRIPVDEIENGDIRLDRHGCSLTLPQRAHDLRAAATAASGKYPQEVLVVEALFGGIRSALEALAKATQRIASAFDMRIVRREQIEVVG